MEAKGGTSADKRGRGRPRVRPVKPSPYTKVGQGSALHSQSRELVVKVRNFFQREKDNGAPLIPIERAVDRSAAALGLNKSTVVAICKEKEKLINEVGNSNTTTTLQTPGKKRMKQKTVTALDCFQQEAIRRHVYDYVRRKEQPTIKKLLVSLRNANLFIGSSFSLKRVLATLGFEYKKVNRRRILLERSDIAAWRCRFLREVKDLDFDKIVWLGETWVNTGFHTLAQGWTDNTTEGKGSSRFVLLHAGTSQGFIPNSCLLFAPNKPTDYHDEMLNRETFSKWFRDSLLPNLSTPYVIVMDNASHHSEILDNAPTQANNKAEIKVWLSEHSIQFEEHLTKSELLQLCEIYKPTVPKFLIDEMAKTKGHKIVRLPPYHCHLNAIEMIWTQVKGYVARNNKAFNLTEVRRLTEEAIGKVTSVEWADVVKHTKETILEAWAQEGLIETALEELITHPDGDDSETSDLEEFADEYRVQTDEGTQEIYVNRTYADDKADDDVEINPLPLDVIIT